MSFREQLAHIANQLQKEGAAQEVSVREFLSWFDAQRRGSYVVQRIREALSEHGIKTEPDFESEYIDAPIRFELVANATPQTGDAGVALSAVAHQTLGDVIQDAKVRVEPVYVDPPYADPTYRISKLEAANRPLLTVTPNARLEEAVTKMMQHGYSQLPVMTSERDVKGVISWSSIGQNLALGAANGSVQDLMDEAYEIRAELSLFQALPIIEQHNYVLVRGRDKRISGIITASDLSRQFSQLSEPFLLLSEIENHVRILIGTRFSGAELTEVRAPDDPQRQVENVAHLTMGECIRLVENPDRWTRMELRVDRAEFCKQLGLVRDIRNDVMHFDPDGITAEQLEVLQGSARFLQRLVALERQRGRR